MVPSTSTLVVVLSLSAAALANPPRRSHSALASVFGGVLKGTTEALHSYTESKQQQQQQAGVVPGVGRAYEEDIEARSDDELVFEARDPGVFGHLVKEFGGDLAKEAIPAFAAHLQSKKQQQQQQQQNGVGGRDFEEGDYEQRDFEDGDFEERGFEAGDFEERDYEDGDFEVRDFEDVDFEVRDYEDGDFEVRDYEDGDFEGREYDEMVDVLRRYVEARYETGGWGEVFKQAGEAISKAFGGPPADTKPAPKPSPPPQLALATPQAHLAAPPSPPQLALPELPPVSNHLSHDAPSLPASIPTDHPHLSHARYFDDEEEWVSRELDELD